MPGATPGPGGSAPLTRNVPYLSHFSSCPRETRSLSWMKQPDRRRRARGRQAPCTVLSRTARGNEKRGNHNMNGNRNMNLLQLMQLMRRGGSGMVSSGALALGLTLVPTMVLALSLIHI